MAKRFLGLILLFLCVLSFSMFFACGDGTNDDGNGESTQRPTQFTIEQNGLTFKLMEGTNEYKVESYSGSAETLTVPDTIDGFAVTKVGALAFSNNDTVKTLIFEDDILNFEANSLYSMSKLETLTLPKNLVFMHDGAINQTIKNQIVTLKMPADAITKTISQYSHKLTHLTITKGDIPDGMFSDQVEGGNGNYKAQTVTTLILEDEVTSVGEHCFRAMKMLETVYISKSITELPTRAFSHAYKLKEIDLPEGLVSIGQDAFKENYSLTEVTLPASLENLGFAFNECYNLNRVIIKENSKLTNVNENAFADCKKLFEIVNLSNKDFELGSTDLGMATIYAKEIFDNTEETRFSVNGDYIYYVNDITEEYLLTGYVGNEYMLDYLPADINGNAYQISSYAFYSHYISGITIPENVVAIGQYAFYNPTAPDSLKRVTFEHDTGWRHTPNEEDSGFTVYVNNDGNNAVMFSKDYKGYYWKR